MFPIGLWDARVVDLGCLHHEGLSVEQERLVPDLEGLGFLVCSNNRRAHQTEGDKENVA